jgi:cytidylate kinase
MTLAMVRAGVAVQQADTVAAAVPAAGLESGMENHASWVSIGGERLEEQLETAEVNAAVSFVARVPEVREEVVRQLRAFADEGPIVMEGRDIGSVVFPSTPWKFYIDASEEVRQSRRAAQGLVDSVRDRDRVDSSRANAPLMVADGAVVIDSDELSPNGVVDAILALMSANGFPVPVAP